jgi:hypothetical protein
MLLETEIWTDTMSRLLANTLDWLPNLAAGMDILAEALREEIAALAEVPVIEVVRARR